MIPAAIRATPWLLPGVAAVLLVAWALRHRVAVRLSCSRLLAFSLAATLGAVFVITLTPSADGGFWGRGRVAGLVPSAEVLTQLSSVNHASLNVAMLVPLGMLLQLLASREVRRPLAAGVFLLPIAIELVQYALPVLGRSGFQINDVVANTLGLIVGTAVGWLLRVAAQGGGKGPAARTAQTVPGGKA